jgi:hypothetical protein
VMTGREALMPAAILHVVKFPIRYTTKKLIWTIIAVKRKNELRFGNLCQKDKREEFCGSQQMQISYLPPWILSCLWFSFTADKNWKELKQDNLEI